MTRKLTISQLILFATLIVFVNCAHALPRVGEIEAFWEDSLAIVRPEIMNPLDASQRRTLETGVPIQVEIDVRFTRTGYVKSDLISVTVEYDVWTGWYRVTTPLSPFAIHEYSTVERLFEQDLLLLFDTEKLDPAHDWFVKVRVGTEVSENGTDRESSSGVTNDLSGFTRFVFQLFGTESDRSPWSDLVKLPRREEESP